MNRQYNISNAFLRARTLYFVRRWKCHNATMKVVFRHVLSTIHSSHSRTKNNREFSDRLVFSANSAAIFCALSYFLLFRKQHEIIKYLHKKRDAMTRKISSKSYVIFRTTRRTMDNNCNTNGKRHTTPQR